MTRVWVRVAVMAAVIWFVSLDRNPVVALIAKLGLSPSPLERLFGLKGLFSGMTEGMYQLTHGEWSASVKANPLTPVFAALFVCCIAFGYRPRLRTKRQEITFLTGVVLLVIGLNVWP